MNVEPRLRKLKPKTYNPMCSVDEVPVTCMHDAMIPFKPRFKILLAFH